MSSDSEDDFKTLKTREKNVTTSKKETNPNHIDKPHEQKKTDYSKLMFP
jgi:hypothetical protein